jgi:hypothetical protein
VVKLLDLAKYLVFNVSNKSTNQMQKFLKLLDVYSYVEFIMFGAGHNRPDHDRQHCYHYASKVKPEAATAVVELLVMGVRTPKKHVGT